MADRVPGGLRSRAEADPLAVDDGVPLRSHQSARASPSSASGESVTDSAP